MFAETKEELWFLLVSGGTDWIWLHGFSFVDSSSIACSWITFLPVCLMLLPGCAGLYFLLWELGLFEDIHRARSLEGCQDQPRLTNTSKGSERTKTNISSVTEKNSGALDALESQRLLTVQWNGPHVSTYGSNGAG